MAAPELRNADGESQSKKNKNGAAHLFADIANRTSQAAGRALTFLMAAGVVIVWALSGPIFHYSDTWQLVINTGRRLSPF